MTHSWRQISFSSLNPNCWLIVGCLDNGCRFIISKPHFTIQLPNRRHIFCCKPRLSDLCCCSQIINCRMSSVLCSFQKQKHHSALDINTHQSDLDWNLNLHENTKHLSYVCPILETKLKQFSYWQYSQYNVLDTSFRTYLSWHHPPDAFNSILDAINLTSIDTVLFTQSDTVLFNSQILCSSLFTQSDTVLFTQIGVFTPWLSNSKTWEYDNLKNKAPVLKNRARWFCRSFCHSIAQDFIYWTWLAWNFSHTFDLCGLTTKLHKLWALWFHHSPQSCMLHYLWSLWSNHKATCFINFDLCGLTTKLHAS